MIRPALAEDADALATLERDAFASDAWSLAQVQSELAGPTRNVLVAESDGHTIGYAAVAVVGDVADLTRIVVAASHRRSGIASELLAALHEAARDAGAERMLLEVAASNADARAFYAARGFAEISRRPGYYADGEDAVVMVRAVA